MQKVHEDGLEVTGDVPAFLLTPDSRPRRRHPTGTPESVAVVACGHTSKSWHDAHFSYERQVPAVDEVWSLNKGLRTQKADFGFVLDDLVGEARRSAQYADDLRKLKIPIMTSIVDRDVHDLFPELDLHAYPLQQIIWEIGIRYAIVSGSDNDAIRRSSANVNRVGTAVGFYMHNSIPMILAYAMWIGVRRVYLYGVDYTYPGVMAREDDRANTEYWVGLLRGQGIEVQVTPESTLLNSRQAPHIYGYGARPPALRPPTGTEIDEILNHLRGV